MKTRITRKVIVEFVKFLDKIKAPRLSLLVIHNEKEYMRFLSDEKTKKFLEKGGLYRCGGYKLRPVLSKERGKLCDCYIPAQYFENIYKSIIKKIHIKCRGGKVGAAVEGIITHDIKKGALLLIFDEFEYVDEYVHACVKKVTGNKILIAPVLKTDSIPKIDGDVIVFKEKL